MCTSEALRLCQELLCLRFGGWPFPSGGTSQSRSWETRLLSAWTEPLVVLKPKPCKVLRRLRSGQHGCWPAVSQSRAPFYGWIIFHCVYVPQLLYPFICWWTSRLLPCSSYCKQCCSGHWDTCVFFNFKTLPQSTITGKAYVFSLLPAIASILGIAIVL